MRHGTLLRHLLAVCGFPAAILAAACAYGIPEVDPVDIPRLQEAVAAEPGNTELQVQLGMAYFKNRQFEQAREMLQAAVDSGQETGPGMLYLGMTQEEFGNWTQAEAAYSRFLVVGRSEQLKSAVRDRLQLIGQNVLRQRAQEALANEENIGEPTPRSIAVMPFAYFSENEDLMPLIYALSDMMTTDFAVSNALTVLERANIQSLLDEIGLAEDGYADPATGARAGRLLQAEHVVQGVLTPLGTENLRIDTDVLNVPNQSTVASPSQEDELQNLFDMEKQLVFQTIQELGIQLTPAEEQQILDNRAGNVLAFLAYGRGLRERDNGNYAAASAAFQQAQQADPTFQAAATAGQQTNQMAAAAETSTTDLANTASTTGETGTSGGAVAPPPPSVTGATSGGSGAAPPPPTVQNVENGVNPSPTTGVLAGTTGTTGSTGGDTRDDPTGEAAGTDVAGAAPTAVITIIVPRPGGGGDR